ncbi:MAG: DNA gyrase inhibitor YacG [Azoarcus sp.]|nr:DNA gyrase inhibitor YacG [Azoarcus sp.]
MSTPDVSEAGRRLVRCPRCGKETEWSGVNPYRPFCSVRCKQIDLGAWASGEYRIAGSAEGEESEASDAKNEKQ